MKKFFSRNKKKREAIAAFEVAELPVEKLLERFHSDSALRSGDGNQRRIVQHAAGVTEEHLSLRNITLNTRRGAAETCFQLQRLQTDTRDVRVSQEVFRQSVDHARTTFQAQHNAIHGLRDRSVAEAEQKLESLSTMADHVATATEVLEHNMRAMSRSRARAAHKTSASAQPGACSRNASQIRDSLVDCEGLVASAEEQLQQLSASKFKEDVRELQSSLRAVEDMVETIEARVQAMHALQAC
jgi:Mg2+ and Co2+ transporter CorA